MRALAVARLARQPAHAHTYQLMTFTHKNSDEDMVTGIMTHSRPTNPGALARRWKPVAAWASLWTN